MMPLTSAEPEFWANRYRENATLWNLQQPAPPFVHLLAEMPERFPSGKLAVLGSGHGHDAALFGRAGFDVIGFDYVAEAVQAAKERYGHDATFVQADIFQLDPAYFGVFDYILEHTCFCAIPPSQRAAYAKVAAQLLKPGGTLIGLFWAHSQPDGPPYRTDRDEIVALFSPYFHVESLVITPHSTESRRNQEYLTIFPRRSEPIVPFSQ